MKTITLDTNAMKEMMRTIATATNGTYNDTYHASDDRFIGGIVYEDNKPLTRCEVWKMPTRIDIYVGNATPLYTKVNNVLGSEHACIDEQTHVKKSKNEICVKCYSINSISRIFSAFIMSKPTKATKTKKTTKKATNKKVVSA